MLRMLERYAQRVLCVNSSFLSAAIAARFKDLEVDQENEKVLDWPHIFITNLLSDYFTLITKQWNQVTDLMKRFGESASIHWFKEKEPPLLWEGAKQINRKEWRASSISLPLVKNTAPRVRLDQGLRWSCFTSLIPRKGATSLGKVAKQFNRKEWRAPLISLPLA